MKCPSLSHLNNAILKLHFRAIGLVNLLPAFHPNPVFISVNKTGLLLTTDCLIYLFNPVCLMCLLIGEFSPLAFIVNIDRCVVIPAI
jgi:hypothetical protein